MAGTNLGTAYVQIMPTTKGIAGNISKELSGGASEAGTASGHSWLGAFKGIIAAAGIGAFFKKALDAGGAIQQSFGGLDTIYGEASAAAKEYAYEAAKAGISANSYAEQAVSFGASLKQAFGGDTVRAAEAANTAIMDMADNSAKMGTDITMIQNAYQGFSKQNYTMLDNLKLGYGGTKKEMERLLEDAQKLSGVEYNIDNLGDVYDAIHVIQQDLGLTGVAAAEAEGTFTGSMAAMKAAAENLWANLATGQDITESLQIISTSIQNFLLNNMFPMIGNILSGLPTALSGVIDMILAGFDLATTHAGEIVQMGVNVVTQLATGLIQALPQLATAAVEFAGAIGSALTDADIIGQILDTITTGLPSLVNAGIEMINNLASGMGSMESTIPDLIKQIGDAALELFQNIDWIGLGSAVINLIVSGIDMLANSLPDILRTIGETALNLFQSIDWVQLGHNVIDFIFNGIQAIGSSIWELLQTIGETALDLFQEIDWYQLGSDVVSFIVDGVSYLASNLWDMFSELASNAWNIITETDWWGLGWDIIQGIIDGILGAASQLYNSLRNLASNALESAKDALGIGSPSKLFRDKIGQWIPKGIADGIERNIGVVSSAMNDIADESVASIDAGVMVGAAGNFGALGVAGGGTDNSNITINVYPAAGMDERALAEKVSAQLALIERQKQAAWGIA